jgi:hypothetical protein
VISKGSFEETLRNFWGKLFLMSHSCSTSIDLKYGELLNPNKNLIFPLIFLTKNDKELFSGKK